jgi:hypothetical protein
LLLRITSKTRENAARCGALLIVLAAVVCGAASASARSGGRMSARTVTRTFVYKLSISGTTVENTRPFAAGIAASR